MEGVLAAFAQFDNDVRSDRTRAGMRAALEHGRWTFPAARLPQCAEVVEREPRARPGTRATRAAGVRGSRDGSVHEAGSDCPRDRSRSAQPQGVEAIPQSFGQMMREPDLPREGGEPGFRRVNEGQLRAACGRTHVLPRPGDPRRSHCRRRSASAEPSGLPAARLRALRRPAAGRSPGAGRRAGAATTRTTTVSVNAARST